ncbi:MAG: DNA-directed RNA polymerase subunit alpha C-terminal domain-containing protein [bacterium]|nr:DNA-directed RNA polymerase subunit alpha C-terminal domain-containing protein [bacterium]
MREMPVIIKSVYEILSLSLRTKRCLRNAEIETMDQLLAKTPSELLRIKNFGRKSLYEIREELARFGLLLNEEH